MEVLGGKGGVLGNVMGCVELGIVCVDYSVSGSGAVSRHKWGWGAGGVASQPFTRIALLAKGDSPPDDRCPPCVYTALALSGRTLSKSLR